MDSSIISLIIIVGLAVLGILLCFWGYKYLKGLMMVFAFLGGTMFMYNFLQGFSASLGNNIWLIAIVVGLILAVLAFFFIKFAIFLIGGILGIMIFNIVKGANPEFFSNLQVVLAFLIGLTFFIVFGALTLAAKKHLIIIFSAILGSYTLVSAFGVLLGLVIQPAAIQYAALPDVLDSLSAYNIFTGAPAWVFYVPVAVLAILGLISQYRFTSHGKKY